MSDGMIPPTTNWLKESPPPPITIDVVRNYIKEHQGPRYLVSQAFYDKLVEAGFDLTPQFIVSEYVRPGEVLIFDPGKLYDPIFNPAKITPTIDRDVFIAEEAE